MRSIRSRDSNCEVIIFTPDSGLIEKGLSNKEIALQLHIELSTVKNHVHNILDKLQLHSRHLAVKYAKAQGLVVTSL